MKLSFNKIKEIIKNWSFEKQKIPEEVTILTQQFYKAEHYSAQNLRYFLDNASQDYPEEFKAFKNHKMDLMETFFRTNSRKADSEEFINKLALMLEYKFHLNTAKEPHKFIVFDKKHNLISPLDYFIDALGNYLFEINVEQHVKICQVLLNFKAYDPKKLEATVLKTSNKKLQDILKSELERNKLFDTVNNTMKIDTINVEPIKKIQPRNML